MKIANKKMRINAKENVGVHRAGSVRILKFCTRYEES